MITLTLGGQEARFARDGQPVGAALALGPTRLAHRWLRHQPPTAAELEAAIEPVEDLVMPLHRRWPAEEELQVVSAHAALATLAALGGERMTRDELEALFNRAVAVAQGRPVASDPQLAQAEVMAAVLVLREVMHHLGFTRLVLARA